MVKFRDYSGEDAKTTMIRNLFQKFEVASMENLIFNLNATMPVFLMMVLGMLFRKTGILKENMIDRLQSVCI